MRENKADHLTPPENMKSSSVAFCLGLVIIMALSSSAIPRSFDNGSCCYKFYTGKIDSKGILKVMKTDSRCSKQGFIVKWPKYDVCVLENPLKIN